MTLSERLLLMMRPLPVFFAAYSRLMRCCSTRTCFSSGVKCSIESLMMASFISGRLATAGCTRESTFSRSAFLAQPGKGWWLMLRARRNRLLKTMQLPPFSPRIHSLEVLSKFCIFTALLEYDLLSFMQVELLREV